HGDGRAGRGLPGARDRGRPRAHRLVAVLVLAHRVGPADPALRGPALVAAGAVGGTDGGAAGGGRAPGPAAGPGRRAAAGAPGTRDGRDVPALRERPGAAAAARHVPRLDRGARALRPGLRFTGR